MTTADNPLAGAIGVVVRQRREGRRILPGAVVVVRVGDVEFAREFDTNEDASACGGAVHAALLDAIVQRVHVITRGHADVAAVFAGTRGEDAARELAYLSYHQGDRPYEIVTRDVERACGEYAEPTDAGPRVETMDQAVERMRVEAAALVERWVGNHSVTTRGEASQALAGFSLAQLRLAGVSRDELLAQVASLWGDE